MKNLLRFVGFSVVALVGTGFAACSQTSDTGSGTTTTPTTECTPDAWGTCTTISGDSGARKCNASGQWGDCVDCKDGTQRSCTTDCGTGNEVCAAGQWVNCTAPQPQQEICDGIDNNCNGQIDEVCTCVVGAVQDCYDGPNGTKDVGICRGGQQTCEQNGVASQWGDCLGQVLPADQESCANALDDDCDGAVNNGCPCTLGDTQNCGSDVGECQHGTQSCINQNGTPTWGPCNNEVPPHPEAGYGCDGLDNDCNGATDDGLPSEQGEPNETCAAAYNLGAIDNDGVVVPFSKLIYPQGDVDWFRFTATESLINFCLPGDPQCHIAEVGIVQPVTPGVLDQVTIVDACSNPGITVGPFSSGSQTVAWQGMCVLDDSMDLYLKVESSASAATKWSCMPYTLNVSFTTLNVDCCTLIACNGSADPVCTNSGCGPCTNGYCTP